jgi:hypothetical protein
LQNKHECESLFRGFMIRHRKLEKWKKRNSQINSAFDPAGE